MVRLPIKDEKIIELYKSGYSQKDIAKQYNVSVVYTRSVLSAAGFNTRGYRALSPAAMKVIEALVSADIRYVDIETVCDISFHAIRDYVSRTDFRLRETNFPSTNNSFSKKLEFLSAYKDGNSFCFLFENMSLQDCDILPAFQCIQQEDVIKHREGLQNLIEKYRADGLSNAGITQILNVSRSIIRNGIK